MPQNKKVVRSYFVRSLFASAITAAFCSSPGAASAAGTANVGPLFTVTSGAYRYPTVSVGRGSSGNFAVAWQEEMSDGSGYNGQAAVRSFTGDGVPLSPEIALGDNVYASNAAVAMDSDGDFVASWIESQGAYGQLGKHAGELKAQRYSVAGVAKGTALNIGSAPINYPDLDNIRLRFFLAEGIQTGMPRVAMDSNGDFAVAWNKTTTTYACYVSVAGLACLSSEAYKSYAAAYRANGVARRWETPVATGNAFGSGSLLVGSTPMLDNGNVLMVFDSATEAYAQWYNPYLAKTGLKIALTNIPAGVSPYLVDAVVSDAAGNFAVLSGQNLNRYSASGSSLGSILMPPNNGRCGSTALAMMPSGGFVTVTNNTANLAGGYTSCEFDGQYYSADGSANGPAFVIDDGTSNINYGSVSIAVDSSGGMVAIWSAFVGTHIHSDVFTVVGRQITPP